MYNYEYLARLQAQSAITNQEIAEQTGVSESTVWRIVKGVAKSPAYENVRDICILLGGSLDEMEGLPVRMAAPAPADPNATLPGAIDYRHYIEMKLTYSRQIRRTVAFLSLSFLLNIALTAFIMGLFAYDIMHPDRGWIQYLQSHNLSNLSRALCSISIKS